LSIVNRIAQGSCCVNRRWAVPGLALHLAFIPSMWLNELQRWATMPVWNLRLHLGPRRAPVDKRPSWRI